MAQSNPQTSNSGPHRLRRRRSEANKNYMFRTILKLYRSVCMQIDDLDSPTAGQSGAERIFDHRESSKSPSIPSARFSGNRVACPVESCSWPPRKASAGVQAMRPALRSDCGPSRYTNNTATQLRRSSLQIQECFNCGSTFWLRQEDAHRRYCSGECLHSNLERDFYYESMPLNFCSSSSSDSGGAALETYGVTINMHRRGCKLLQSPQNSW